MYRCDLCDQNFTSKGKYQKHVEYSDFHQMKLKEKERGPIVEAAPVKAEVEENVTEAVKDVAEVNFY